MAHKCAPSILGYIVLAQVLLCARCPFPGYGSGNGEGDEQRHRGSCSTQSNKRLGGGCRRARSAGDQQGSRVEHSGVAGWQSTKYTKPRAPSVVTACLKLCEVV
eukprot:6214556-Pleurochrysis_carterae.AAC.2